jgi:Protein of unknown function (DUF2785)
MQLAVWLSFAWIVLSTSATHAQVQAPDRAEWVALAKGGFALPDDRKPVDVLEEMNPLLASLDPVLRDEVAFSAAERWIVRERKLSPDEVRRVMKMWLANLDDGLGTTGDDRVFKRSFSALNLSLVAAYDLVAPFMEAAEVQSFFNRMLDYFVRENDLRGFDQTRGWMHTVAHTSDVLKFLLRNPKLAAGSDVRLLSAIRAKIDSSRAVFAWGENDRMALAVQSAVRRADADFSALESWLAKWAEDYQKLWANGPHVDAAQFALVENGKQLLRGLHTALTLETKPTLNGDGARKAVLATLGNMR